MNMFIYDSDCRFCAKFTTFMAKTVTGKVEIVPSFKAPETYQDLIQETSIFLAYDEISKEVSVCTHNESIGSLMKCSTSILLRCLGRIICDKSFSSFFRWLYIKIAKNRRMISRILFAGGSCKLN